MNDNMSAKLITLSPISQALGNIFDSLDGVDRTIIKLHEKLQPVLSQESPPRAGENPERPDSPKSDLALNLEGTAERIRFMEIKLLELINRIEL